MKKLSLLGFALLATAYSQAQEKPASTTKVKTEVQKVDDGSTKVKTTVQADKNATVTTKSKTDKNPDKVTGTYNGKTVYTATKGGRYYINSNGNKTYIDK